METQNQFVLDAPQNDIKVLDAPQIDIKEEIDAQEVKIFPEKVLPEEGLEGKTVTRDVTGDLKAVLKEFYIKHNPEKLNNIDVILTKFKDKEELLVQQLKEKYGSDADSLARFVTTNNVHTKINSSTPTLSNTTAANISLSDDFSTQQKFEETTTAKAISTSSSPTPTPMPTVMLSNSGTSNSLSTTISAGVQDISSNLAASLLGWQKPSPHMSIRKEIDGSNSGSGIASNVSTAVSDALSIRLNALQNDLKLKDEENTKLQISLKQLQLQVLTLKKEKSKLMSDSAESSAKMETTHRTLASALDRETASAMEASSLAEQLKEALSSKGELQQQLDAVTQQRDNKNDQLQRLVCMNHLLSAQLRFLTSRVYESGLTSLPSSDGGSSSVAQQGKGSGYDGVHDNLLKDTSVAGTTNGTVLAADPVPSECIAAKQVAITEDFSDCTRSKEGEILEASLEASRAELCIAMHERQKAENALLEQANRADALELKLSNILSELETASGSADSMKRQLAAVTSDLTACRAQLLLTENRLRERTEVMEAKQGEIDSLQIQLVYSESVKKDVAMSCLSHTRRAEAWAMQVASELSERIYMEREECLGWMTEVVRFESEAKAAADESVGTELRRIREELFKSRRSEAQKDRELVFMQRQLCDAAGKIAVLLDTLAKTSALSAASSDNL